MARVNHRSGSYPLGQTATDPNARSLPWPAVQPHSRGLQPPPNDPRKLKKECTRIAWALHCLQEQRAKLVVLCERKTAQMIALRRQHDAYSSALQDMDPVLFAEVEQRKKDWDDPIKALAWAQRGDIDDVYP